MRDTIEIRRHHDDRLIFTLDLAPDPARTAAEALGLALQAAVAAGIDLTVAALRNVEAPGADLSGGRLRGAELSGANLNGANLAGADLTNALLLRVSAIGANFDGAILDDANAWMADFAGASLKSVTAVSANFDAAGLQGAELDGADFTDASVLETSFAGARARGLQLIGVYGTEADFTHADLTGAALDHADLRGARLDGARLDGATLAGTQLGAAPERPFDADGLEVTVEARPAPPPAASAIIEIGWRRPWLVRAVPGGVVAAGLSGWMAFQLAFGDLGSDLSPSGRVMLALMFAAFVLILGGAALTYGLALFDPRPVVRLDAAGIHDRRLSPRPIAWAELTSLTPMLNGGQAMLAITVARPKTWPLPPNPLWAASRLSARMLGRAELSLRLTGLDTNLPTLLNQITHRIATSPSKTAINNP